MTATTPSAHAVPGWAVEIQDNFGEGGIGPTVDSMTEGEILIALGGAPEASGTFATVNFVGTGGAGSIGGDSPFPGGFGGTDDWALNATGFVTGISNPFARTPGAGVYALGVNSDDGFRVRLNGTTDTDGAVIGSFEAPRGPGDTFFISPLANGNRLDVNFFERGGGEEVEFFRVNDASDTRHLVGAGGSGIGIDTAPTLSVAAADFGWNVEVQNASATPGVVGPTVDNVNEAETLIAGGGAPEATDTPLVINYLGGGVGSSSFPAGTAADDYAVYASGYVDVVDGYQSLVSFYVNSDDGFRLYKNGVVVSEFVGPTGGSNTISNFVTLSDGDFLELFFFERGGGNFVILQRDFDGSLATTGDRALVGLTESGIHILQTNPVPEPVTLTLLGLGGLALLGRRRRLA